MDGCFIESPKKLKERSKFLEFKPLINLVELTLKENFKFWTDLEGFFYLDNYNYEFFKFKKKLLSKEELVFLEKIEQYFEEFSNSSYDFNLLKGAFLELYMFKYFSKKYPMNIIKRECKVKYGDFESQNTVDLAISFKNEASVYECKSSTKFLKRKHLDNLYSIYKNSDGFIIPFLVIWINKPSLERILKKLQCSTSDQSYFNLKNCIEFRYLTKHYIN